MLSSGLPEPVAASTGLPELDRLLGGLYWGDNVVWERAGAASLAPFLRAALADTGAYDFAGYVSLASAPEDVAAAFPGLRVVDARPGTEIGRPEALLAHIAARCAQGARTVLLFDPLETMAARWGADATGAFFSRCCPKLLELGAIVHWTLDADADAALRRRIDEVTQCIVVVARDRLRIAKADGRPPGTTGGVLRYRLDGGVPALQPASAPARLATALRAARLKRGLSQSELARLAGVTPSAISQAERGQRGLSLETVVELSERLDVSLDELLRGDLATGYRIGRLRDAASARSGRPHPLPLLDDPEQGLRAYVVHLPAGLSARPHLAHKRVELVAVAQGLVQVVLATGTPVLRRGEVLVADDAVVEGWRNLGDGDALLFWILRDD